MSEHDSEDVQAFLEDLFGASAEWADPDMPHTVEILAREAGVPTDTVEAAVRNCEDVEYGEVVRSE